MLFYSDTGIKVAKNLQETKVFINSRQERIEVDSSLESAINTFVCIIPASCFPIIWLPTLVQSTRELDQL